MSAAEKTRLSDELIRENADSTIRDYLDWVNEIERIGLRTWQIDNGFFRIGNLKKKAA